MANPLKVLTALSASSGVAVSGSDGLIIQQGGLTVSAGGLTVSSGETSVGALTASSAELTTVDINGGSIDGASIGATSQAAGKFTTISGSSNLEVGGSATIAGQLTVQGGMTVNGTLTTVNTTNLEVTDKKIIIASGSTTESGIDEAGIYFGGTDQDGGGAVASITYNSASTGEQTIKITDNLELPVNGAIYADLANSVSYVVTTTNGVSIGGGVDFTGSILASPYHGATNNQSIQLGEVSSSGGGVSALVKLEQGDSFIQLTNSDITFGNTAGSKTLTELSAGSAGKLSITNYYDLRSMAYGQKQSGGSTVTFKFSGSSAQNNGSTTPVGPGVTGLSSSTSTTDLMDKLRGMSFDVAVRNGADSSWSNDLVSVLVTASAQTSGFYWPSIVVDAPGVADDTEIRLIITNETQDVIS